MSTIAAAATVRPVAPQQPEDTGLPPLLLRELVLKAMLHHGLTHLHQLCTHLKLTAAVLTTVLGLLRRDSLVELRRRGDFEGDVSYQLTQAGRAHAFDALARNPYCAAAPVPLAAYAAYVQTQADVGGITREQLERVLSSLDLGNKLREQLGVALTSRRATLLYGPSGSGKTYLCQRLAALLTGTVAVPHALEVGGEIVRVFDPLVHRAEPEPDMQGAVAELCLRPDARWVACKRPFVATGFELTPAMLELTYDSQAGCYHAPPQLKANNGLLLVDELGRQAAPARQLLARWLAPMEQRHDCLALRNGNRFRVPVEARLFFATHLHPDEVADEAFLRRIGQRIHVGALAPEHYRRVVFQVFAEVGVQGDEASGELLQRLHCQEGRPLLASTARELAVEIAEHAAYLGVDARVDAQVLHRAWKQRFAAQDH